jgi:hypothetical protein
MVLNRPDDTVITRHPLADAIVRAWLPPAIAFVMEHHDTRLDDDACELV